MTDQSIEDAKKEFEQTLQSLPFFKKHSVNLKSGNPVYPYDYDETNLMWELWQASRQSSQSEPVDLEKECLSRGIIEFDPRGEYLVFKPSSVTDVLEAIADIYLAAPQQAIPFGWLIRGGNDERYKPIKDMPWSFREGAEKPEVAWTQQELIPVYTASPTAPIESDK
jgi:hypothetical protein